MIDGGCIHYKMTRKEQNQYTSTEMSSNQQICIKLAIGGRYLYKMTGSEPNQYISTEMSPDQ